MSKLPNNTDGAPSTGRRWTFLSNHAHVLVSLAAQPEQRIRDLAASIGITERAIQRILANLEEEGMVQHEREGRRNVYSLHLNQPLRHPLEAHCKVQDLVDLILSTEKNPEDSAE